MANQGPWGGGSNDKEPQGGKKGEDPGKNGGNQQPPRPWGAPQDPDDQDRPPPRGGQRRPDQIPEIEELMRKGQDRLRVLMGGRGSGPQPPRRGGGLGGMLPSRGVLGLIALALVALWVYASFYTVRQEERSVEFLFGRPVGTGGPGLNFAPWPVVTAEIVQVTGERVTEIGSGRYAERGNTNSGGPLVTDSGLMLTRDQNIVNMEYQVVWNISDPEKYLLMLADPGDTVRAVAESAMRDIIARTDFAPVLNRDRGAIGQELATAVQQTLDSYQSGIHVVRVNLDRAEAPDQVIDSFRDVQAAQQERDRLEKEADAYANRVLAEARGQVAQLGEEAEAYRAQAVNGAEGEAARFNAIYDEYAKAPDVTRRRMYLETMEKVLGGVNKVILDGVPTTGGQGSGVVPYLPLDRLTAPTPQGDK
ncbi:FtsH protease activity modulator HflK [Paracoccus pacificus]|uniref:Protein HflK n=1 Tax=Paracoccus pacificus TaxID=1463598 RepID=A0ABW4RB35_9RHOB